MPGRLAEGVIQEGVDLTVSGLAVSGKPYCFRKRNRDLLCKRCCSYLTATKKRSEMYCQGRLDDLNIRKL